MLSSLGLSGGSAASGATTGDVIIPSSLFEFPEYPAGLSSSFGGVNINKPENLLIIGIVVFIAYKQLKKGK